MIYRQNLTGVFLGKPSPAVEAWIKTHEYPPTPESSHAKTWIKFSENDKWHEYEIKGDFGYQSLIAVGLISEGSEYGDSWDVNPYAIELGTDITSIGFEIFMGCSTSLRSVVIPDSVEYIADYAFYNCSQLTHISIPDGVEDINSNTFAGCSGLTSVTIPDSVTYIGNYAFDGCHSLSSIMIPDSVTIIADYAFVGCSGLTSVTIGSGVTNIGSWVFEGCTSLKNINSNDGVYIPDGTQTIGHHAFYNSGMEKLSFNNLAAMGIDSNAFAGCNQLSDVVVRGVTTHEAMSLENYPWGISNENIIRGDRGA